MGAAGDALLKTVVVALRENMRTYDLIIRVGGGEFVCVLSGVELGEARTLGNGRPASRSQ